MLNMDTAAGGRVILTACSNKTSEGVVANQFPAGLRVLVVDDDPTCLKILERMLRNCLYEVTTCTRAIMALSILRERKLVFDLVLSDVHMPDMDGFKLLEHIGLEMDLPVIMMSVDDKKDVVMKGVTHGACDYLIKPIRIEAIKNIWQHVVRKRRNELKELEQSGSYDDSDRNRKTSDDADYASSANEGSWKNSKRRKEEEDEVDDRDDTSTLKKPRVVWSVELHQQFVAAVNQLGIDKAVPKKILELMNVPGLTRENVASHLQKYRLYLRRLSGVSQHQSGLSLPFLGTQEANFGSISSLDGFDLQTLSLPTPLPPHSLVSRSTGKSGIGMTHVDPRNPFSPDAATIRFAVEQELNGSSTQVNIFHGCPTNVEPKQLPHLHQSVQLPGSFVNLQASTSGINSMTRLGAVHGSQTSSIMAQMPQSRSRGQLLNEISGDHPSGVPLSIGQHIISNEMAGRVLGRNVTILNDRGVAYNPGHQASPSFDFHMNNTTAGLPGNGFPLGINAGLSNLQSTEVFQDRRTVEVKESRGIGMSYDDIFNELQQGKTQDWEFRNGNLNFQVPSQGKPMGINPNFSEIIASHQSFASIQKTGQNQNTSIASNPMSSLGENQFGTSMSIRQQYNYLPVDSLFRIKSESMNGYCTENVLLAKNLGQDDLMSAILKQQQEADGSVESESNFDGYSIDDIQA